MSNFYLQYMKVGKAKETSKYVYVILCRPYYFNLLPCIFLVDKHGKRTRDAASNIVVLVHQKAKGETSSPETQV